MYLSRTLWPLALNSVEGIHALGALCLSEFWTPPGLIVAISHIAILDGGAVCPDLTLSWCPSASFCVHASSLPLSVYRVCRALSLDEFSPFSSLLLLRGLEAAEENFSDLKNAASTDVWSPVSPGPAGRLCNVSLCLAAFSVSPVVRHGFLQAWQDSPLCIFSLCWFPLYPFTAVNHHCEYQAVLSAAIPPPNLWQLGVVLVSPNAPSHLHVYMLN